MRELDLIREDIDGVDDEILRLYRRRMQLADEVADYKIQNKKPVYDRTREDEKLAKLTRQVDDPFLKKSVRELFELIMSVSRKKQYCRVPENENHLLSGFSFADSFDLHGVSVCYQGVEGAYSHAAALSYFPDDADIYHVSSWRDALSELVSGKADFAVLPIENSRAGAVDENYDLLYEYDAAIVGEVVLPVSHALLGLPGADPDGITDVYSHPQALMQCSQFLQVLHPDLEAHSVANTALAASRIKKEGNPHHAAIASELNASLYDLKVLARNISDDTKNRTRFVIVSNKKCFLKSAKTVSVCFELPNSEGTLYRILSHFVFNDLNMTRIESRPIVGRNWEYRFFVDFEGSLLMQDVSHALLGLGEEAKALKILGNY